MSSTHIHIADTAEAIKKGVIPGAFNDDRTAFTFPTIVSYNARGVKILWTINVSLVVRAKGAPDTPVAMPEAWLRPRTPAPACVGVIMVEALQEGGKVRDTVPTYVLTGKNLGKANETNVLTQALRDALGQYNKHLKRAGGDAAAPEERKEPSTSTATPAARGTPGKGAPATSGPAPGESKAAAVDRRPAPMLVKKLGETSDATLGAKDFKDGVTAQPKFDGVRITTYVACAAGAWDDPDAVATVMYSRTGGEYAGLLHLRAPLRDMLLLAPPVAAACPAAGAAAYADPAGGPPPVNLDGELYLHGKPLNYISGQARKADDDGSLEYWVFDCFFPGAKAAGADMPSRDRQRYLDAVFAAARDAGVDLSHVVRVPNTAVADEAALLQFARDCVKRGFEGAIARKDGAPYRYGTNNYHSANLVKIKPIEDAEFRVVGFTQGSKGKDVGAVIWTAEVAAADAKTSDREFDVVPKDITLVMRKAIFLYLSEVTDDGRTRFEREIKGLMLTVEFPGRSAKTGKPLQAKARTFRTYEGGPEHDPVRRMMDACARIAKTLK